MGRHLDLYSTNVPNQKNKQISLCQKQSWKKTTQIMLIKFLKRISPIQGQSIDRNGIQTIVGLK
jgi:hypothetical protein